MESFSTLRTNNESESSAFHEMSFSNTVSDALEIYQNNFSVLQDWMFLFSDYRETGPFQLIRKDIGGVGILSTVLDGNSLYVIDKKAISSQ
ncbi:hypothetical protein [Photorhabdus heterorhabditis]|uniref:hypothetical protein n=1 Tax=Photorhabdus heterorhabditis TaxID=880156 RepID=UPI001BD50A9E|nr:hypothetical protein [Photorhabdus heterorhabditis]MBS9443420.1 hypothetical protein [Photorhabdus heterorhabditis]